MTSILERQVAVISGGLGDIGRAIAMALAAAGADVAICDLAEGDAAAELLADIAATGRRGRYDRVDVADAAQVRQWLDQVERSLGTPTLIIPNAAVVKATPLLELQPDYWRKELAVNLDGVFHLANGGATRLVERGLPGCLVFIGSWAAEHVHLQIPTYCVAKAGIRMLAKCMAAELAPRGIRVNELAPGFVSAGLDSKMTNADPEARERHRRMVPTGELIEPAEVARQVVHLCDPNNRHLTGAVLVMDGGLSLFGSGVINPR